MLPVVGAFKGEFPRVSVRKLPPEAASEATNCRLLSGDLEAFKNFGLEYQLSKAGDIRTIFPLDIDGTTIWLSWADSELGQGAVEVDVAKSISATDGRVFLTGLDVPRWTNNSLATQSGSSQWPAATRPLGVPNPGSAPSVVAALGANPAIDIFDDFSNPSNWVLVPENVGTFSIRRAEIFSTGVPTGGLLQMTAQEITASGTAPVYAYRDCGIGDSAQVEYSFDFRLDAAHSPYGEYGTNIYFMCDELGNGLRLGFGVSGATSTPIVGYALGSTWSGSSSSIAQTNVGSVPTVDGNWYRVIITASRRTNGNYNVNISCRLGSGADLFNESFENVPAYGGYCGHGILASLNADRGPIIESIANVIVMGSAPTNDTSDDVATSYVYTFVNDIGEESGPSDPSATIFKDDGTTVTVTTATSPPTGLDYYIETKRIYRAVTTAAGTDFLLVAEIPLSQADYDDTLEDSALGEVLPSTDWALPPDNLRGILALPNEIYVGFTQDGNELCLSAQGFPHAWPINYRLRTDEPIVAIGNVDAVVVIATKEFPYTASGTVPENYSMTKAEVKQGCVSKRGCLYLKGFGWIYPSPDGFVAVAGVGQPQLITQHLFTRKEWQALAPETMICDSHDNRAFCFYEVGGIKKGMMIDATEGAFGKVTLGFHAKAMYSWARTDTLYLVMDENQVPIGESPSMVGQLIPNEQTVYAFDSDNVATGLTGQLPCRWVSKQWPMRGDIPRMCRVYATDYSDIRLQVYADGVLYRTVDIADSDPFTIPKEPNGGPPPQEYFQFALAGTSAVQSIEFGYDADDFAP